MRCATLLFHYWAGSNAHLLAAAMDRVSPQAFWDFLTAGLVFLGIVVPVASFVWVAQRYIFRTFETIERAKEKHDTLQQQLAALETAFERFRHRVVTETARQDKQWDYMDRVVRAIERLADR